MKRTACYMSHLALIAGGLSAITASAHSGVDGNSGFLSVAVHQWLHQAWAFPSALLGAIAALATVLVLTKSKRTGPRQDRR